MPSLEPDAGERLIRVARESIAHGLRFGGPLRVDLSAGPEALTAPGASFVTLRRQGALRGCVGSLTPCQPLVIDVAENAWRAAFADDRFPRLREEEQADLSVHVSVLGPQEPLPVVSRAELLAALEPGRTGLVVAEGARRATFLPAVWESLPEPTDFLAQLMVKAGLPRDHWSPQLRFWRYDVQEFSSRDQRPATDAAASAAAGRTPAR